MKFLGFLLNRDFFAKFLPPILLLSLHFAASPSFKEIAAKTNFYNTINLWDDARHEQFSVAHREEGTISFLSQSRKSLALPAVHAEPMMGGQSAVQVR